MTTLLRNPYLIVTIDTKGKNVKRGKEMSDLYPIQGKSILIENGHITGFIDNAEANKLNYDEVIDLTDKIVLPGFIECHTHTAFAGSRGNEFRLKLKGATYEDIARMGGGINTTVQSVRSCSKDDLIKSTLSRIKKFVEQGVTTLEIKSGYGLDLDSEIKLLEVVKESEKESFIDLIPTFLGAHTFPPEFKENRKGYIELITNKMISEISAKGLAVFCDAFCETTAFHPDEVRIIFKVAESAGLKLKLHSEQFNNIGGLDLGLEMDVKSIDHLEVIKDDDIIKLANSNAVGVLLPGVSFFLNYGFAPARKLIDNNGAIAISTDFNPGSSHISNLHLVMSIAAIKMKMSVEEVISSVTINAAKALDLNDDRGSIEIGKIADFAVFNTKDYSDIIYHVGENLNCMTIKKGKIVYSKME